MLTSNTDNLLFVLHGKSIYMAHIHKI